MSLTHGDLDARLRTRHDDEGASRRVTVGGLHGPAGATGADLHLHALTRGREEAGGDVGDDIPERIDVQDRAEQCPVLTPTSPQVDRCGTASAACSAAAPIDSPTAWCPLRAGASCIA